MIDLMKTIFMKQMCCRQDKIISYGFAEMWDNLIPTIATLYITTPQN